MSEHWPALSLCQSDGGDSKHVSRWRPLQKPTPGSQLSLWTAEVISCDKSWLQEVHDVPRCSASSLISLCTYSPLTSWDNAWLTCWTSHLALNSHCCLKKEYFFYKKPTLLQWYSKPKSRSISDREKVSVCLLNWSWSIAGCKLWQPPDFVISEFEFSLILSDKWITCSKTFPLWYF